MEEGRAVAHNPLRLRSCQRDSAETMELLGDGQNEIHDNHERQQQQQLQQPPQEGFSFFVAMAFTINFIIGSGFLTIPWAFSQTGVALGVALLVVLTGFAIVSSVFVVETMARAGFLLNGRSRASAPSDNPVHRQMHGLEYEAVHLDSLTTSQSDLEKSTHAPAINGYSRIVVPDEGSPPPLVVDDSKLEVTDLCLMFLGRWGLRVYTVFIALYTYGTLWAYSTVFAKSFNAIFGPSMFGNYGYGAFLVIFACLVVPMSMLELTEQVGLQVTLSVWRVVMLVVMVSTICVASVFELDSFKGFEAETGSLDILSQFSPSKLYILLPIVTYANIFHHSIPSLSLPVKDKTQVANIFCASLGVCIVGYLAIGLSVAVYFGHQMAQASNLNWASYVFCSGHRTWPVKVMSTLVSRFVVLFPACDVASAFPLNAITLGNNLMSNSIPLTENNHVTDRKKLYFFRALASVPPIVGAFFVQDLGKITNYTGLCGCAISFVFPSLLSYSSELSFKRDGIPYKTRYAKWYTGKGIRLTIFLFGVFVIVYVFICNMLGL
jgi:amino acid permease